VSFAEAMLVIAPLLGQTADLVTTERGIRSGLYETNPAGWAQDTNQRRVVKLSMGVAMSGTMYLMKRKGVSKEIRIMTSVLAAATGLVPAVINVSRTH